MFPYRTLISTPDDNARIFLTTLCRGVGVFWTHVSRVDLLKDALPTELQCRGYKLEKYWPATRPGLVWRFRRRRGRGRTGTWGCGGSGTWRSAPCFQDREISPETKWNSLEHDDDDGTWSKPKEIIESQQSHQESEGCQVKSTHFCSALAIPMSCNLSEYSTLLAIPERGWKRLITKWRNISLRYKLFCNWKESNTGQI